MGFVSSRLVGFQFRQIPEKLECLQIGQGVQIFYGSVVNHVTYGDLHDFVVEGTGDIMHLNHLGWPFPPIALKVVTRR